MFYLFLYDVIICELSIMCPYNTTNTDQRLVVAQTKITGVDCDLRAVVIAWKA